jgi:hypothetical protein
MFTHTKNPRLCWRWRSPFQPLYGLCHPPSPARIFVKVFGPSNTRSPLVYLSASAGVSRMALRRSQLPHTKAVAGYPTGRTYA